ncbi:CRISPR/Cas system-associated RecB-like nuclease Cas4, type I-B/HMARI [Campylobacter iguaniorum]|uniref:CRISPR/Cas system-associated RecB-like nuclease Cas4, type I-B/HMARI n=1 Tax=Campylobacter iguaniorum TaxID=1244531 RepID=A0A076F9T6_9BACT|nr:Dna2/Cas4 domain-containing protein [Campylobacter iguaniorum]AII14453.1 CRISPR/Cas system-associated RecB-like nuclease Cas4, type I-B/HMARI [Campylobacter iguaniorum]ALV24188.1 CRISPR/Cas system-associated RecB-like nuclease Cas4, type I-B/HMARI [Campylobacter iguaniorum]
MFNQDQVSGTLVNYFTTCKREAWLYAHQIHARQDDENILMGKALASIKEPNLQDFPFSNLKFDKLSKLKGHYQITEYKKTLKNKEAAINQLLFYMYILKTNLKLKLISGKVICGKTVLSVEGNDENFVKMKLTIEDIVSLVNEPKAPPPVAKKICKNCAYNDYCF